MEQVFINHRGPDTKLNIASLIHRDLKRCGLNVFLDMKELHPGDIIWPKILESIRSASVHITIFSKRYAESRPCLDELYYILKSSRQRAIIPVFYDVQPRDLKNTHEKPYADAFQRHQLNEKISTELVEDWKKALRDASEISGIVFNTDTSNYGDFLDEIVKRVLNKVKQKPYEVERHPLGLDQALLDLEGEIGKQSAAKVVMVGILGISGIGKSTLARHFFELSCSKFDRNCCLSKVRDHTGDLRFLQWRLIRGLCQENFDIPNTEIGESLIRSSVKGFKSLIVLDDIDRTEQIKALLHIDALDPGSLVLVTCRDMNILKGYDTLWYEVKELEKMHARELFCRHAFLQSEPLEGYKNLVEKYLNICGGLPLCLEVLGGHLCGNLDRRCWELELEEFSQGRSVPPADVVIQKLRGSYDSMDIEVKDLFLDIGCFFVGEDTELAVRVSEGLCYDGNVRNHLNSLRQKCFVGFENNAESDDEMESGGKDENPLGNRYLIKQLCKLRDRYYYVDSYLPAILPQRKSKIIMQTQVRELARRIVSQDLLTGANKPLRLSCSVDIENILRQDGSKDCCIRGILIPTGRKPPSLTNTIVDVRLLIVEQEMDLRSFFGSPISSGNLVWLRLRNVGFISIPSTISVRDIRVLEFQGHCNDLENLFNQENLFNARNDETLLQLRELNICAKRSSASTSNSHQPDDLQYSMETSDGNFCSTEEAKAVMPFFYRFLGCIVTNLTELNKIVLKNILFHSLPTDFSSLRNLRHLDLSGSTKLTKLPTSFSQLLQLQHLALRDCENLSIPMDILGEISTLEYVDFKGCAKLEHLPEGVASQTSLRYLNLLETSLLELPANLDLLDKLEHLRIGSPKLKMLPCSMASLKGLKELFLLNCPRLDSITPIEELKLLERLYIHASSVKTISPRFKNIKVLTICECQSITEISFEIPHVMDALRDFTLWNTSITKTCIPADVCPGLEEVDLSYNICLTQVHIFPSTTLLRLTLEGCSKLKTLTNLAKLVHLKFLNVNGCTKLETLDVEGLTSLEEISAEKCWQLRSIEAFNQLERLNFIRVSTYMHGRTFSHASEFEKLMQAIVRDSEHFTLRDVPVRSRESLDISHRPIIMCFLTYRGSGNGFGVCFEPSKKHAVSDKYETFCEAGKQQGIMLHMYMWTEDSKLFKDENQYSKVDVYGIGNESDVGDGEAGWIATSTSKTSKAQVLEACKLIMFEGTYP